MTFMEQNKKNHPVFSTKAKPEFNMCHYIRTLNNSYIDFDT